MGSGEGKRTGIETLSVFGLGLVVAIRSTSVRAPVFRCEVEIRHPQAAFTF